MTPPEAQEPERFEVELIYPMPMTMAGAIMEALGSMWPASTIRNSARGMTMLLPHEPTARVAKRALAAIRDQAGTEVADGGEPVLVLPSKTGDVRMTVPEEARRALSGWAAALLTSEAVPNYVEQQVTLTPDDDHLDERTLLLTACWSPQQTPHQLRQAAEQRADELQARLDRIVDYATYRQAASGICRDILTLAQETTR